jgi:hypothetical protein
VCSPIHSEAGNGTGTKGEGATGEGWAAKFEAIRKGVGRTAKALKAEVSAGGEGGTERARVRKADERAGEVQREGGEELAGREEQYWRKGEGGHVDARTWKAVRGGLKEAVAIDGADWDAVQQAMKPGRRKGKGEEARKRMLRRLRGWEMTEVEIEEKVTSTTIDVVLGLMARGLRSVWVARCEMMEAAEVERLGRATKTLSQDAGGRSLILANERVIVPVRVETEQGEGKEWAVVMIEVTKAVAHYMGPGGDGGRVAVNAVLDRVRIDMGGGEIRREYWAGGSGPGDDGALRMILRAMMLMTADKVEAVDWGRITNGDGGRGAEEQEEGVSKALREYYAAAVATGRVQWGRGGRRGRDTAGSRTVQHRRAPEKGGEERYGSEMGERSSRRRRSSDGGEGRSRKRRDEKGAAKGRRKGSR